MKSHEDFSEPSFEIAPSIHRSPNVLDLRKLHHEKQSTCANRQPITPASHRSKTHGSEDSGILYMALPKLLGRSSLSAHSNRPTRYLDGGTDKSDVQDAHEQLFYSIIDREISEWQHICRTGRPSWWLPESRHSRTKNLHPWQSDEPEHFWYANRRIDNFSKQTCQEKSRAVSDNLLSNPTEPDDLARIVAIQLLSSCFTLPLDHTLGPPFPAFASFNKKDFLNLPDFKMISSLLMHIHFRYSPCFGHQPRNPSPASSLSRMYDGQYPGSHGEMSPPDSIFQAPVINKSASTSMRRRHSRIHYITECSTDEQYRPINEASSQDGSIDSFEEDRNINSAQAHKMKDWLQAVIRWEPHSVFIQPVRELAVQRWKSIRRRFGRNFHDAMASNASEDMSVTSGSSFAGAASSGMSNDASIRRLRAQERGEIYSSSDSTYHYDAPVSIPVGLMSCLPKPPVCMLPKPISRSLSPSYWSKNRKAKESRKSMLSEIYTPNDLADFDDISTSSHSLQTRGFGVVGSTVILPTTTGIMARGSLVKSRSIYEDIGRMEEGSLQGKFHFRPRLARRSTNGTQVFSPNDDGAEINGLPVGSSRHTWDGEGKSREPSYL